MIKHSDLGASHFARSRKLLVLIKQGDARYGGNSRLKIYGRLNCASGKRMKAENRVFFTSVNEAETEGYRPCGHCMRKKIISFDV